ncbi:flippase [Candidatus Parcubacteria bacterium]|nr:flippase [Candidatus Parcubacteria bacterium]
MIGAFYLAISSMLFMISGYIITVWLGRSLGPADYGIYGVVITLMTIVNLVQTMGLPQAMSKFLAEDEPATQSIFKSAFILQAVTTAGLTGLFFVSAPLMANLLNDPALTRYLRLAALIYPFYSLFALYLSYYNGTHSFGRQALLNGAYSAVKVLAVIGLAYVFKLYGAIAGFIVAPTVALFLGPGFPKLKAPTFNYKKLIMFSLPLVGFSVLAVTQFSIDLLFVKALVRDDTAAGYFAAIQNIGRIPYYGLNAFALILFPAVSRSLSQGLREAARTTSETALRYVLLILILGCTLIAATSQPLILLIYGDAYREAATALAILIAGYGFLTLYAILASIINGAGKPYTSMLHAAIGTVATALLCWGLIPAYGIEGAAAATTVGGVIAAALALRQVRLQVGTRLPIRSILKGTVAAIVVGAIAGVVPVPPLILPVWLTSLTAVYGGLLLLMGEVNNNDFRRLKSLIPKNMPVIGIYGE